MIGDLIKGDTFRLLNGTKRYSFIDYKIPYAHVINSLGQKVHILVKASDKIVRIVK